MQGQHHSFRGLAVFHANSRADNSGYTSVSLHWLDISLLAPARICLAMCSSVSHVSHIVNIFFHLFQSDSVRHEIKIWQIRIVLSYFLVKQFGRAQQNTTHGSKLSLESCKVIHERFMRQIRFCTSVMTMKWTKVTLWGLSHQRWQP